MEKSSWAALYFLLRILVMPLMWSVSNPSVGGILSASGLSAIYESNGTRGQNSVTVVDQSDAEGVAAIEQR